MGGDASNAAAKRTALEAYDVFWPHHPLPSGSDGLYRRFEVGDVLFLALDTRFNRSPTGSGMSGKTMLGQNQKDWFKRQLEYGAGGPSPIVRFHGRRGEEDGATLADVEEVFTLEFSAAQTFNGF